MLRWRVACRSVWVMIVGGECGEWVVSAYDYGDAVVIAIDLNMDVNLMISNV